MGARTLTDLLETIETSTSDLDAVSVGDLLEAFEDRSFGPLLLLPGFFTLTPLGMIPGFPTAMAVFVILVASQRLFGRSSPWTPKWLRSRSVGREKLVGALRRARPWTRRLDRLVHPRLGVLVEGAMGYVLGGLAVLVAMLIPPLEVVPFAVVVPACSIVSLGLAKTGRDGLLALFAIAFAAGTLGLAAWVLWLR